LPNFGDYQPSMLAGTDELLSGTFFVCDSLQIIL